MSLVAATPPASNGGGANSRAASGIVPGSRKMSRQQTGSSNRQSRVSFPASHSAFSYYSQDDNAGGADFGGGKNPFVMPPDTDVFLMRDKERQRDRKERNNQKTLKVHEKLTYAAKVSTKAAAKRREAMLALKQQAEEETGDGKDQDYSLAVAKEVTFEKESLPEYISKKREMFLVQYSLGVKRDEMRKLEQIALAEEKKLEAAEKYLEQDAQQFDEFLQENDKNSVQAIKVAEQEQREKQAKQEEIKKTSMKIAQLRSEISKQEETLKEYTMYKAFLDKLTPKEWLDAQQAGGESDVKLYFKEPQQLLNMFAELEEQNLTLIQNSQETEEALEEMKQQLAHTMERMNAETDTLKKQIEHLNICIAEEEDKARDLELRARMFQLGDSMKEEDQEKLLLDLNKKVETVYRNCIGENEANLSTLAMLTAIENRLEELFQQIETMPADKVAAAEKEKEQERRKKAREMKIEKDRKHNEERTKKALQRANEEPKKQVGKKLVFRSEPVDSDQKDDELDAVANREEEEWRYFFQW